MRLRWLLAALFLSVVLLLLHLYAEAHAWYWIYRWFDIPMHLLGGLTIGTFSVALLGKFRPILFLVVVAGTSVGWEVIEYVSGITYDEPFFWFDTFHDLLNDALGSTIAYIIARNTVWR